MNMGATFDGMLQILQFQSQKEIMAQMMNLAMKPEIEKSAAQSKQIQEEAAAKSTQNSVDVSTYITDKALELVKANPGMDFDDAREKILDTMDRIEKRQSK